MLDNLLRDETLMPRLQERFAAFRAYLTSAQDILMHRRAARPQTRAAVGHAIAFSTWKSLVREEGLSDTEAAALCRQLVVRSQ